MKIQNLLAGAAISLAWITPGLAQDKPEEHLAKARALAFQDQSWDFPGLLLCYPDQLNARKNVVKDLPPLRAFDNFYNIGTGNVTSWAITTSAGIIVIDALDNPAEADQYIMGGLRKLGFDPRTVKYVVITHGHGDHSGGASELQAKIPGVHILLSPADWKMIEDAVAKGLTKLKAPKHDMEITDGQKLTLGDETVTLYLTPGHTPGTVSLLIPVKDHGTPHTIVFIGGTGSNGLSPEMNKAYDLSMEKLGKIARDAHADGYISNHEAQDDGAYKLEYVRELPKEPNPFLIGAAATARYFDVVRECHQYVEGMESRGKVMRNRP